MGSAGKAITAAGNGCCAELVVTELASNGKYVNTDQFVTLTNVKGSQGFYCIDKTNSGKTLTDPFNWVALAGVGGGASWSTF